MKISRERGDRSTECLTLGNLGLAHHYLEQYPQAIEFFQQSLAISRDKDNNYIREEAFTWFNLGLALENVNRESDALGAYHNARELFHKMGLDADVQHCNDRIERLSQPQTPVVTRRGFWAWLHRLWRWVRSWFRR